ncbi:MAG: thioredoxin domain-containing protein [Planctomycetes bacterium]|nr:thioredoxin domain-containing protein [Planctomycetota bacterium]
MRAHALVTRARALGALAAAAAAVALGAAAQEPPGAHPPRELPPPGDRAALPPDGGPGFNRLVFEQSPYLRQHARNPVDWYPWGDEAFARARREDKPVFLSVGYATCHWCHVMERESFEDAEVAAVLSAHFMAVKVDREERPDVDAIYMAAVQAVSGRGGWPMSVFLTPAGEPFFAGTYFRRDDFLGLLRRVAEVWRERQPDVLSDARRLTERLRPRPAPPGELPDAAALRRGRDQLMEQLDPVHGGLGTRPKFPQAPALSFLLRWARRADDAQALAAVERALDAIARGGIRDHLGGGFHRYATDRAWLVPHFEKMLYDQALLARLYVELFQVTGADRHAAVAREALDYVLRDLRDPGGAFRSAEDADSEGVEGKFYVWTYDEVVAALGPDDGAAFARAYGVTPAGNYHEEASGEATGTNILHLPRPLEEVAGALGLEPGVLAGRLARGRARLLALRAARARPLLDDKVLTDWNGLAIAALAYAGRALDEPRYLTAAREAADFLLRTLRRDGHLYHRYRAGDVAVPGLLDDHAFLALGLLELYEATFEARWLREALGLARVLIDRFGDPGGRLLLTRRGGEALLFRPEDPFDGAVPSGAFVAAQVLLRLGHLTGNAALTERALGALRAHAQTLGRAPGAMPSAAGALDLALGPWREVTLAGAPDDPALRALSREVHRRYLPRTVLAHRPADEAAARELAALVPMLAAQPPLEGRATAYVCRDYVCDLPTQDVGRLAASLEAR